MIENPTFDSQTKEALTLKSSSFGSLPQLSDKFMKSILKSPIVDSVTNFLKARESAALQKKMTGGKKKKKLYGIDKLEDANDAGTQKSSE
jgi:DNA topoisomerase II